MSIFTNEHGYPIQFAENNEFKVTCVADIVELRRPSASKGFYAFRTIVSPVDKEKIHWRKSYELFVNVRKATELTWNSEWKAGKKKSDLEQYSSLSSYSNQSSAEVEIPNFNPAFDLINQCTLGELSHNTRCLPDSAMKTNLSIYQPKNTEFDYIVIPSYVIFLKYYGRYTNSMMLFFNDEMPNGLINFDKSELNSHPKVVCYKNKFRVEEVHYLLRFVFDEYAKRQFTQAWPRLISDLKKYSSSYLNVKFPFQGETNLTVTGTIREYENSDKRYLFVNSIDKCSHPLPSITNGMKLQIESSAKGDDKNGAKKPGGVIGNTKRVEESDINDFNEQNPPAPSSSKNPDKVLKESSFSANFPGISSNMLQSIPPKKGPSEFGPPRKTASNGNESNAGEGDDGTPTNNKVSHTIPSLIEKSKLVSFIECSQDLTALAAEKENLKWTFHQFRVDIEDMSERIPAPYLKYPGPPNFLYNEEDKKHSCWIAKSFVINEANEPENVVKRKIVIAEFTNLKHGQYGYLVEIENAPTYKSFPLALKVVTKESDPLTNEELKSILIDFAHLDNKSLSIGPWVLGGKATFGRCNLSKHADPKLIRRAMSLQLTKLYRDAKNTLILDN